MRKRHAGGEVVEQEPRRDGGGARQPRERPFAGDARPRPEQRAPESAMAHEEIHEHAERREGIGAEDAPPGQLAEHGMGEPDEHREEEDLEAHERDEHDQQAARLALRRDDQVGDEHADHREDDPVEHRVLHDEVGRDRHGGGVGHALEGRRAEEGRRSERAALGRVVDQEPHGDDGGSDEPGDDAFADIARIGGHSSLLCRRADRAPLPRWRPGGRPPDCPAGAGKAPATIAGGRAL